MKNKTETILFWNTAKEYLSHYLPQIRNASPNTVASYRDCLNHFITYLDQEKHCIRKQITFEFFSRDVIKDYIDWMRNEKKLAPKTCNLRLTAIHSLLEYASTEFIELMPVYLSSCTIKTIKLEDNPIEYFEPVQMKALLAVPDTGRKTGRRNQMMLILMYDTAARVSELMDLKINSLHLNVQIPYLTIFGKGRKYRNIPLMNRTIEHLNRYLNEFHSIIQSDLPLFYAVTHGNMHKLSTDTMEKFLKHYNEKCISTGVEMPNNPHCQMIRKTRAMNLYQNGVPLTHIQQLLGHKNISTTSGFYAFATLDTLSKAMNYDESSAEKRWEDKDVLAQIYRL